MKQRLVFVRPVGVQKIALNLNTVAILAKVTHTRPDTRVALRLPAVSLWVPLVHRIIFSGKNGPPIVFSTSCQTKPLEWCPCLQCFRHSFGEIVPANKQRNQVSKKQNLNRHEPETPVRRHRTPVRRKLSQVVATFVAANLSPRGCNISQIEQRKSGLFHLWRRGAAHCVEYLQWVHASARHIQLIYTSVLMTPHVVITD